MNDGKNIMTIYELEAALANQFRMRDVSEVARIARTALAKLDEAERLRAWVEKSPHLHDCCHEYNEETKRWEQLDDSQCWCGRTAILNPTPASDAKEGTKP